MSDRRLTPELLIGAYATGIFPMAESRDDPEVYWVDPRQRGILPFEKFHISRSLARRMRKGGVTGTLNRGFTEIVDGCAERDETWINDTIRSLVIMLNRNGYAHAFGLWRDDRLIGGMYGIALGGAFFGESMFSRETDASKIVMALAVHHLSVCGFTLFDTQFITDHLARLGAIEVSRKEYRSRLARATRRTVSINAIPFDGNPQAVVQRMTQTS